MQYINTPSSKLSNTHISGLQWLAVAIDGVIGVTIHHQHKYPCLLLLPFSYKENGTLGNEGSRYRKQEQVVCVVPYVHTVAVFCSLKN